MLSLIYAFRSATVVLGIAAFANLLNRLVANSGLREYLIGHQLAIIANAFDAFTYAAAVFLVAYFYAGFYWRDLFPERIRWLNMALCFALGLGFAAVINHPAQVFLFKQILGQVPEAQGTAMRNIAVLLTMPALASLFAIPFTEELTYRGILFREGERLPIWVLAILSFLIFCLVQFANGDAAKLLSLVPAALLFVAVRLSTKSFIYAAAAHVGLSLVLIMKLQVL
jgi:membrane protease YdiL (CAAX protease family)